MTWLLFTILAYFILAIVFLMDKYLLSTLIPNPKLYAFYTGFLGILIFIVAPFVNFYVPPLPQLILALLAGMVAIFALFWFYKTLQLFETSRVVPAIGGILPLFTLLIIFIFSGGKETLKALEIPAFIMLLLGSILITYDKSVKISLSSFKPSTITAFFFALAFALTKYVYLNQPFWNGLIWMGAGGFLTALYFFVSSREIKEEIFKKQITFRTKTLFTFLLSKTMGVGASFLQNWAIFLVPVAGVAIINALQGVQYAFLLILTVFLSMKFPEIFKEKITKEIIFQKIIAILFIGLGLTLLILK